MKNEFVFIALPKVLFESHFEISESELRKDNATWVKVDSSPGYPCRVSLEDARVGERVLAISFEHHNVDSPYKASGPIFVREYAKEKKFVEGEVPSMLRHRSLSLRGYNSEAMMIEADVVEGKDLEKHIYSIFNNKNVEYIHVHNAKPGCFNCSIRRA